jgi:hypothetical protein
MDPFDFSSIFMDADFEERPVQIEEFMFSPDFCGMKQLSDYQLKCLKAMTQIYKESTLIDLFGEPEGRKRFKQTNKEIILQLGKGSGKDMMSSLAVAYIVYQLLCLRDPAEYFGKPSGDPIAILNIAINANQAKNVFFSQLVRTIENCSWFKYGPDGPRYSIKNDSIAFDKNVTCHSGHSEREAWEGYNLLVAILDEISGFALENTTGHAQAKTAEDIHKMYKASVSSRFQEFGKTILLSFPRFKGDYIQQKYEGAIAEKIVNIKEHTFILNEEIPEDSPGNKLTIQWEEDDILTYMQDKTFCLKRPTWEVNPTVDLNGLKGDFFTDQVDALSRFACMPPDSVDGFFRNREKVEIAFSDSRIAVEDQTGVMMPWFKPEDDTEYFIHVDLAQKHDHCAVAMAHIDGWAESALFSGATTTIKPLVVVDMVMWWTPSSTHNIDLDTVRDFIIEVHNRGFNVKQVSFDRWNSIDIIKELNAYGMNAVTFSVKKQHYQDFFMVVAEERVKGPYLPLLISELMGLRLIKDKVDHPRTGSKDLSDAVCGAIANAILLTEQEWSGSEVEVITLDKFQARDEPKKFPEGTIVAPKLEKYDIPHDISEYLESLKII